MNVQNLIRRIACLFFCLCGMFACAAPAVATSPLPSETVGVSDTPAVSQEVTSATSDPVGVRSDSDLELLDVPSVGTDFDGLAFMDISSSLGDIRLYLPYGVDLASLQIQDGCIYNTTNSTVYLYCREYPAYTFSASRFASVMYRVDTGYSSVELTSVKSLSVSAPLSQYKDLIVVFVLLLIAFMSFRGGVDR